MNIYFFSGHCEVCFRLPFIVNLNTMDKSQYKDVCVFVEQREGIIQKVALELLGKARELADTLNEKVIALLLGYDMKDQAQELIAYGADIVVCVDERELAEYNTEPYAQAVSHLSVNVIRPSY